MPTKGGPYNWLLRKSGKLFGDVPPCQPRPSELSNTRSSFVHHFSSSHRLTRFSITVTSRWMCSM
jgi:hypothetical protein